MSIKINSRFDGGNIDCLSCDDPADIQLAIRKDNLSDFYQWFYFRLTGAEGVECSLKITNAGQSSYVEGWEDYQAVASYDKEFWFRVPTHFENGVLQIDHMPEYQSVYYAYFAPYSAERGANFIGWAMGDAKVQLKTLGQTVDGRDLDQLRVGIPLEGRKKIWVIARQHPGETMASWWMEGFIERLLDEDDAVSCALLEKAVFYIVPNMNPDGSVRGHLRTNAAGANLNREWLNPSLEKSPEVFLVREAMEKTGVDFNLDVHGDEALPYNFIAAAEGIPAWTDKLETVSENFGHAYMKANPDFQMTYGYPKDKPGEADLSICTNYIAQTFACPAVTLEMPFKDTIDTPREVQGWSPERSQKLGASAIDALYAIVADL